MSADSISAATFGRVPTGLLFSSLPDRAIRLYAVLTRYADQHDEAMPGRQRLGRNLDDVSVDTVDRAIRALEDAGWLTVERVVSEQGDPDTNRYHLHTEPQPRGRAVASRPAARKAPAASAEEPAAPAAKKPTAKRTPPAEHPDARRLCELMADHAEAMTGERPTITGRWLDAARLLLTKDGPDKAGYSLEQLEYLIAWVQKGWWASRILSMPKLREKRTGLIAQIKAEQHSRGKPTGRAAAREVARLRSVDELTDHGAAALTANDLDPSTLELLRGA